MTQEHVHGCKKDALKGFIQAWNGCQLHHVPSKECNTWKGFIWTWDECQMYRVPSNEYNACKHHGIHSLYWTKEGVLNKMEG